MADIASGLLSCWGQMRESWFQDSNDGGASATSGVQRANGDVSAGELKESEAEATSAIHCEWCGAQEGEQGERWHVCRCMAVRCDACARYPCHNCTAQLVEVAEAEQGNERSEAVNDSEATVTAPLAVPATISPDQAHNERLKMRREQKEHLEKRRAEGRRMVKDQCRRGLRPRRVRKSNTQTRFVTANPNCADGGEDGTGAWRPVRHG